MWFSGLRGAIAFALSLEFNSEMDTPGTRVIESTTLVRPRNLHLLRWRTDVNVRAVVLMPSLSF